MSKKTLRDFHSFLLSLQDVLWGAVQTIGYWHTLWRQEVLG